MPRSDNRVFLPQEALDEWIVAGLIELDAGTLVVVSEGRSYTVTEAVRIVREVSGSGDEKGLVSLVKERAELESMGAEIVESSILLGDSAYDVVPGWLASAVGTFAEHAAARAPKGDRSAGGSSSDEEIFKALSGQIA
jgi:hypothetical protein